jgi:ABC-type polysaccharide/polyol phosphate transport system, ATPase component
MVSVFLGPKPCGARTPRGTPDQTPYERPPMIQLERVTKTYRIEGGLKLVLDDIDFVFPTGLSVGILGMNGAGKSTLLRLLAGADQPTSGRVVRNRRISWPVSLGGFNGSLTGEKTCALSAASTASTTTKLCATWPRLRN